MVPSVVDNVYQKIENIALDYLESVAEKLQDEELDIETITKQGPPAQCILETVNEQNCDLIIIGTHGETDSPSWRFGGVAGKIVKAKISIPLLIIPTD
jgi:nucleotide-binding universal stress UspA family protein